jgi:TatA/E family protein of Tat protein translocase
MFGSLGVPELMLILAVALIVFGPRKLPEIGRTLGKALGEFRKATDDLKSTLEREVRMEELRTIAPAMMTPVESVSRSEPLPAAVTEAAHDPHTTPYIADSRPFPIDPAPAEAEPARDAAEPTPRQPE